MLKTVIVGSAHPLRGGLASYNERLAQAINEQGHDAKIYSFSLQYPEFLFPGKTQVTDGPAPENLEIITTVNSINPFNWIKVGNELKKMNLDILILKFWLPFMGPCLGTIARIVRSNKHTKVICILDNVIPHEKRPGDKFFANYFVGSCDAFIAMSRSVMDDLKKFDDQKPTAFNPHPLFDNFGTAIPKAEAKQRLGLDPQTNYLLFFGFIRGYKGLDLLLEAFSDKRFRELPLKLIIAGEYYQDSVPYEKIIKDNHLEEFIIRANDFIPNEEVASYFCAADLVVQPYKTATQSGVTQIAYQFNKPMIVSDVGGLSEIVPDGKVGYVVKPDPKPIAKAILDFYENKREAEFVDNVKEEKKRFSWEMMFQKIIDLYEELKNKS